MTSAHKTSALLFLLISLSVPPVLAQLYKGREGLAEQTRKNIEQGEVLYAQNCAFCHGGAAALPRGAARPKIDITQRSEAWSPGPLRLWRSVAMGDHHVAGHRFEHLGEQNIWRVVQAVRARADLQGSYDEPEEHVLAGARAEAKTCFAPIKEELEQLTSTTSALTLAVGKAAYAQQCASCHGADGMGDAAHVRAPKLASAEMIWRRRAAPLDMFNSAGSESGISAHKGVEMELEEQWALVRWMRSELVPVQKQLEQPDIPMRGHIKQACEDLSEPVTPKGAPPEQYASYEAWRAGIMPADLDMRVPAQRAMAKQLYERHCALCHAKDGRGEPGMSPPLAGADWLKKQPPAAHIDVVLVGASEPMAVNGKEYTGVMPPLRGKLSDREVSALLTYMGGSWGNKLAPVTTAQVSARRAALGLEASAGGEVSPPLEELRRMGAIAAQPCAMCHVSGVPASASLDAFLRVQTREDAAKPHPLMGRAMTPAQLSGLFINANPGLPHASPQQVLEGLRRL